MIARFILGFAILKTPLTRQMGFCIHLIHNFESVTQVTSFVIAIYDSICELQITTKLKPQHCKSFAISEEDQGIFSCNATPCLGVLSKAL